MADAQIPKSFEDVRADREALEHIARALEGSLAGEVAAASAPRTADRLEALNLKPETLRPLFEAMPAGLGLLAGTTLVHANAAFAYAFGYGSFQELLEAGGLEAILPGGVAPANGDEKRRLCVDALTRGRRRIKATFEESVLDAEADVRLLRLVDQASLDEEGQTPPPAVDARENASMAPEDPDAAPSQSDSVARRLDFLAKVSHEVRTPLNSILGFTELMREERFGPIGSARYKGYVEDIHQSGRYALSLINDLLDISKIEAGKFELDFTAVDVPELVEDCVNSLQPLAKRERILLRTFFAPNLPAVIADRRHLRQVLLNLLSNAIKFTNAGGQVIVSGSTVEGGAVRLRVRDNGVGMTEDEIALAMQPFRQLDTAPRRQTGTGLGLPLTKALAEANRARFELTSERGAGTAADIVFPADRLVDRPALT